MVFFRFVKKQKIIKNVNSLGNYSKTKSRAFIQKRQAFNKMSLVNKDMYKTTFVEDRPDYLNKKILVLFVFHEFNKRVKHFIDNCIFPDENVDFIVISNGKNNIFEIPHYARKIMRDNVGYDFGGWSEALLTNKLYENYDNFIFVNSSVMGPFIHKNSNKKWIEFYLDGLTNDVKLFGSTINTIDDPLKKSHVQSYIFCMDKNTLQYLIKCEIFSITNNALTFHDAIHNKEVLMSRKIIENNWNIGSLLPNYQNVDFTFKDKTPADYKIEFWNDIMFPWHENSSWNRYEIVFIKGNRCGY